MISTRDLSLLSDVSGLRCLMQSLAMLDAVLCREEEFRYYSFNSAWAPGEQLGSMRNGSGDDLVAHFGPAGCWIKGFAHEYPMSPYRKLPPQVWPGVLDAVPDEFAGNLEEPAFSVGDATFCLWRRHDDSAWELGPVAFPLDHPDPDGSEFLLFILDGRPESYQAWAAGYYGRELELDAVEHVYRHRPLTPALVARLNPEVLLGELAADIDEIGYPAG